jgi:hypothetical protein
MKAAIFAFVSLYGTAVVSTVAGVYLLAGLGWALISVGGFSALAAAFIVRGTE